MPMPKPKRRNTLRQQPATISGYRGEEHEVEFGGGNSQSWPLGRMTDFLEGGGPEPLSLSARAVAHLDNNVC